MGLSIARSDSWSTADGGASTSDAPPGDDALPSSTGSGFPFPDDAVLVQAGRENFPVATRLLPRTLRNDLMAIYGFARLVDDVGDEAPGDRTALLDLLGDEIDRIYHGRPQLALMRRLAGTVLAHDIPPAPLRRLLQANRQDQEVTRYATRGDLVAYCALSANPVGELVLHVFDRAEPDLIALSDSVCTALQLAEHWQDVAEDLSRGRVYLPQEDLERWHCTEAELAAPTASPRVRRLIACEVDWARRLLDEGTPLVARLHGLARLAVAGYVAGGRAALRAIADAEFDVLAQTRRPARRVLLAEWPRVAAGGGRW